MDLNDIYESKHLKANDFKGKDVPLTISNYEIVEFQEKNGMEKKVVLHFAGTDKTLVVNKTNANTIADMHGTDIDVWPGKQITLFPTQTDMQGRQVACIRVRIGGPVNQLAPQQPPATDLDAPDTNENPF